MSLCGWVGGCKVTNKTGYQDEEVDERKVYCDLHEPLLGVDPLNLSRYFPFAVCEEKRGSRAGGIEEGDMVESFGRGHDVEVGIGPSERPESYRNWVNGLLLRK